MNIFFDNKPIEVYIKQNKTLAAKYVMVWRTWNANMWEKEGVKEDVGYRDSSASKKM